MEVGIKVWVADDAVAWRRGVVLEKLAGGDGSAREVRVRLEPAATANPSGARDEWDSDSDEAPGGQSAHEHEERVVALVGADGTAAEEGAECAVAKLCNVWDSAQGESSVADLITLTHLHEPAILAALQARFARDTIYTNTGPILLAVNPFKRLGDALYGCTAAALLRCSPAVHALSPT